MTEKKWIAMKRVLGHCEALRSNPGFSERLNCHATLAVTSFRLVHVSLAVTEIGLPYFAYSDGKRAHGDKL